MQNIIYYLRISKDNNSPKRNVIKELKKTLTARNPGFSTDDTITVEKARELGSGKSKESSSQEQHPQKILLGSLNKIQATFVRKLNGLKNKIIITYAK